MTPFSLQVNGKEYGGWISAHVSLGIEQIAGIFELSVSDRWPNQLEAWQIKPGDECVFLMRGEPIITGYVDQVNPSYSPDRHEVRVSGRDKTGDLVDCAAVYKSGEWHNVKLDRIASDLCQPFNITVVAETDLGEPFRKFALQEGEAAFEAIERAAKMRQVLLVSDGKGKLLLTRAGTSRISTVLMKGENIEGGNGTFDHKDRYSEYIVKGQSPGSDDSTPAHNAQTKATVKDTDIKRYRPMIIHADQGDRKTYTDRANWEKNVRQGRGSRVNYVMTGWEHKAGPWKPNVLVPVKDPFLGVDGELVIASVKFSLDDGGTRTELELCRPEAFELPLAPEEKRQKGRKSKDEDEEDETVW